MHEAGKLATGASVPQPLDTTTPPAAGTPLAPPTGIPAYADAYSRTGSTALSLHAPPVYPHPHPVLPLPPPPLPPPPPLQSTLPRGPADIGGTGGAPGPGGLAPGPDGGETGGQVVVHWKQSGGSVQPSSERVSGGLSGDDDEDPDDEDDELLSPPPPRERLSYTRYQLELLNGIFDAVRYPNSVQKQLIAKRVGISREQVKIWFQNRRRKDVVASKSTGPADSKSPKAPQEPTSPSASPPTSQASEKASSDNSKDSGSRQSTDADSENSGESGSKSRMVPDSVVNGCISELKRFTDEKIKERKEKRKAKGKRRAHAASATSSSRQANVPIQGVPNTPSQPFNRLFQTYDMAAPPNKVSPTAAYLDTSANRFTHSLSSSAFSNPRDYLTAASGVPRLALNGMDNGLVESLGRGVAEQLAHSRSYGALGVAGLGMGLMPPTSQAPSAGAGLPGIQDSLPVLTDILSYRQQADCSSSSSSRDASLTQHQLLSSSRDAGKLSDPLVVPPAVHDSLTSPPAPFSASRVLPMPFIADPPILLSSLHQHDPFRLARHWPYSHPAPPSSTHFNPLAPMNMIDPYKPVMISSLTNPYFSPRPPSHPGHWLPQPGTDPARGSGYSQR